MPKTIMADSVSGDPFGAPPKINTTDMLSVSTDIDPHTMSMIAEKRGNDLLAFEQENQRRVSQGLEPLPDPDTVKDELVQKRIYPHGVKKTATLDEVIMKYNRRKHDPSARLVGGLDAGQGVFQTTPPVPPPAPKAPVPESVEASVASQDPAVTRAQSEAEHARDVQNRHSAATYAGIWGKPEDDPEKSDPVPAPVPEPPPVPRKTRKGKSAEAAPSVPAPAEGMTGFPVRDLYTKLGKTFDLMGETLYDILGRVEELKGRESVPEDKKSENPGAGQSKSFLDYMSGSTTVTFSTNGISMRYEALHVEVSGVCLTVVSKLSGSNINPKPGADLEIEYTVDGKTVKESVVFLGTHFVIEPLNLSFMGFIRSAQAKQLDVDAQK